MTDTTLNKFDAGEFDAKSAEEFSKRLEEDKDLVYGISLADDKFNGQGLEDEINLLKKDNQNEISDESKIERLRQIAKSNDFWED